MADTARLPGSKKIPRTPALRACLGLKLWAMERKIHMMALVADEGLELFCALDRIPKKSIFSPARYSWRITTSIVPANARYRSQNWLYFSPSGWVALYSCHSSVSVPLCDAARGESRPTAATAKSAPETRRGARNRPPSSATPQRYGQSPDCPFPRRGTAAEPLVPCAWTTSGSPPWSLPENQEGSHRRRAVPRRSAPGVGPPNRSGEHPDRGRSATAITVHFNPESVSSFHRNQCPVSSGIRSRNPAANGETPRFGVSRLRAARASFTRRRLVLGRPASGGSGDDVSDRPGVRPIRSPATRLPSGLRRPPPPSLPREGGVRPPARRCAPSPRDGQT